MKIALATLLALTPVSALAGEYQQGYSASRTCFKTESENRWESNGTIQVAVTNRTGSPAQLFGAWGHLLEALSWV